MSLLGFLCSRKGLARDGIEVFLFKWRMKETWIGAGSKVSISYSLTSQNEFTDSFEILADRMLFAVTICTADHCP